MASWQRHLHLQPEWGMAQEEKITRAELARTIAERLAALRPFGEGVGRTMLDFDDERQELVDCFESLADDGEPSERHFNSMMEELYDWGDQSMDGKWNGKKVCWVDTTTGATC